MLVTRETDYAIRVLRALADGEMMTAGDISDKQMVPKQFAYKIIKKLERAGMVSITRGAEGGCRLTADLDQATLYDLMVATDRPSPVSLCMEEDYVCPWRQLHGSCQAHSKLHQIQNRINDELRNHTLRGLIYGDEE